MKINIDKERVWRFESSISEQLFRRRIIGDLLYHDLFPEIYCDDYEVRAFVWRGVLDGNLPWYVG